MLHLFMLDTQHSDGRAGSCIFMPNPSAFFLERRADVPLPPNPSSLLAPLDSDYLLDLALQLDCRSHNYNEAGWSDERPEVTRCRYYSLALLTAAGKESLLVKR